jgi:hypothetical protein
MRHLAGREDSSLRAVEPSTGGRDVGWCDGVVDYATGQQQPWTAHAVPWSRPEAADHGRETRGHGGACGARKGQRGG